MAKRKDARIYIFMHKRVPYEIWDNSLYTPLQVGAEGKEPLVRTRDNKGDNISEWNPLYAEITGTYWIWKNRPKSLKYVGQTQYRRRIALEEDTDFDELFSKYDLITMWPVTYKTATVGSAYSLNHSGLDLPIIREIIEQDYPDYLEDFDYLMKEGNLVFYSNGFIMRSKEYDRYCEWLFGILGKFMEKKGWDTVQHAIYGTNLEILTGKRNNQDNKGNKGGDDAWKYQRQVPAFLSERLFTLWVAHEYDMHRVFCYKYKLFEDTEI